VRRKQLPEQHWLLEPQLAPGGRHAQIASELPDETVQQL
jgi:hypothetical protein